MTSRTLLPRLMKSARAVVVAGLLVSGCATSDLGGPQVNTDQPTAAASAVAYRYANIEGRRVFYREAGSRNNPTIVFLHGFPTSSHMYRELIPLLADRFHVIAPDYIGFGHSDAPPVTEFRYTFDQLASVVDRLLGGLRVTKYILYVQDYGGPVGFRIAAAHPERVKGFVIQNANAYADGLSDAAKGFLFPLSSGARRPVLYRRRGRGVSQGSEAHRGALFEQRPLRSGGRCADHRAPYQARIRWPCSGQPFRPPLRPLVPVDSLPAGRTVS